MLFLTVLALLVGLIQCLDSNVTSNFTRSEDWSGDINFLIGKSYKPMSYDLTKSNPLLYSISSKDNPAKHLSRFPESTDKIGAKFTLFDRDQWKDGLRIAFPKGEKLLQAADLQNDYDVVVFMAHGFTRNDRDFAEMKDRMLAYWKLKNPAVILVDWRGGAGVDFTKLLSNFVYLLPSVNTMTVGRMVGTLAYLLDKQGIISSANIHLIGHSLGAHVMHFASEHFKRILKRKGEESDANGSLKQIGRISGLDPAGPEFTRELNEDGTPAYLNRRDAAFVDIIHTSGSSGGSYEDVISRHFGIDDALGHVDFYPNGGTVQPACDHVLHPTPFILDEFTCSHDYSVRFFTDSLVNDVEERTPFTSIKCDKFRDEQVGRNCLAKLKKIKELVSGQNCVAGEKYGSMGMAALDACGRGVQYLKVNTFRRGMNFLPFGFI